MPLSVKLMLPVFLIALVHPFSESYADAASGLAAFRAGDYEKAYAECLPSFQKGDALSQLLVGHMYGIGRGVQTMDATASAQIVLRAAKQGNTEAQYITGTYYFRGFGRKRDRKAAFDWFRKAAENGHSGAQVELAREFSHGEIISGDHLEARKWYKAAALQGHVTAQVMLGDGYLEGKGVAKNSTIALHYYIEAAKRGYVVAYSRIARMFEAGNGVAVDVVKAYFWYSVAISRSKGYASELLGKERVRVKSMLTPDRRAEIDQRVSRLNRSSLKAHVMAIPFPPGAMSRAAVSADSGKSKLSRPPVAKLRPDNDYAVRLRYFSVAPALR